ncbi:DEPDC1 [Bugula neritina]|uniref:DEPDC1 n=1 Tax=Bugula neritina TaxID=10212 RepID=A0A7J7IZF9_BUGNE|nr:DEPDC1 [Bugula neritina]
MSVPNIRNEIGPYKATKLWNDIIRIFRAGMPIGRHWKQLRPYDDCFVASEAVDWLFEVLQHRHDSSPKLTRSQVLKLLQKFHRSNYIVDVRGHKYDSEVFEENGRLFRFVALSPIKTPQWPRMKTVSMPRDPPYVAGLDKVKTGDIFQEPGSSSKLTTLKPTENKENASRQELHPVQANGKQMVKESNVDVLWKTTVLRWLEDTLLIDCIQNTSALKYQYVKHNMTVLHKNGYVTGFKREDLPPAWIITAMRYLDRWPEQDGTSPNYEGFEKDVFGMIKEYFDSLKTPLIPFDFYLLLLEVFKLATASQPSPIESKITRVLHVSETTPKLRRSLPAQKPGSYLNNSETAAPIHPPRHSYEGAGIRASIPHRDMMVVYDEQPRPTKSLHHPSLSERNMKRWSTAALNDSYKDAVDINGKQSRATHKGVCKSLDKKSRGYNSRAVPCQPPGNIPRSVSMSRLLAGPKVETAFVGDDAYTVYHHTSRSSHRTNYQKPTYVPRAQSVYNLYDDQTRTSDTHTLVKTSNLASTRAKSERCVAAALPCNQLNSGDHSPHLYSQNNQRNPLSVANELQQKQLYKSELGQRSAHQPNPTSYQDTGSIRLQCHSSPYALEDSAMHYGLFQENEQRLTKSLQLILLFLPPSNRRVLHMVLRLLHKLSKNKQLVLDENKSNKALVIASFRCSILRAENARDEDIGVSSKLLRHLVDFYDDILAVPTYLKQDIERQIIKENEANKPKAPCPVVLRSRTNLNEEQDKSHQLLEVPPKAVDRLGITPNKVFCKQVTSEEYKTQATQIFDSSMKDLLNNIVGDTKMSAKEKTGIETV